jgi:outer membrane protein, heavy metal efflux system
MSRRYLPFLAAALAVLACGCATTDPAAPRREVGELVTARVGAPDAIAVEQDAESRARVRQRVAELVAEPLTLPRALQLAMLNNRGLAAELEALGVAQADLVEAGLLENPVIAGDLVNSTAGNGLGGGLSLTQSLLSAFLIPAKRRLARAELRHAVVSVGGAALMLARDVKIAYVEVQAAAALHDLHRTIVQAAEVADELAQRQHEVGNLPDLDRARFAAALHDTRLAFADRELALVMAREHLTRLLGLWGADTQWTLAAALADPPATEGDLDGLEQQGIRERLDVSAARIEVESIGLALGLRRRGLVPQLEAGLEARNEVGNDAGHEWVLGPSLSLELPIFDPGHADIARIRSYLRRAEHQLQHVAIVARSEIRVHREELVMARRKVGYYQETVLPQRNVVGARALEQYNGMLIGTYELLETRTAQIEIQQDYVEAVRSYWIARADLELAVGGQLADPGGHDEPRSQRPIVK